jgi:hypothetical protein
LILASKRWITPIALPVVIKHIAPLKKRPNYSCVAVFTVYDLDGLPTFGPGD